MLSAYLHYMNPAERYILEQKEPFRSILLQVQLLIEATLPDPELLYKWKIPVYQSGGKIICYLNVSKGYVDVAFWAGEQFKRHQEHLQSTNRKFVRSLRYWKPEDIDPQVLTDLLEDAYEFRNVPFKAR